MSDDLHEDLSAAFTSAKEAPAPVESAPVQAEAQPGEQPETVEAAPVEKPAKVEGRDERGRFAPKPPVPAPTTKADAKAPAAPAPVEAAPAVAAPLSAEPLKPPQSWKAGVREKFATLPPEVQQEVLRREKDITTALNESVSHRKTAEEFQRVLAPFEPMIRASGSEPIRTVTNLLQTAHALHTAPPVGKAQMVAQIIKQYGVDVAMLDEVLSGEAPTQRQGAQQFHDPRLDPILSQLQQAQQARAQKQQQEYARVQQEASEFAAKSEFFEDVRPAMMGLLQSGVAKDFQDAYDRACWADPEIRGIIQQRQAAQSAATAQAATTRALNAASSVKSQPAGPPSVAVPDDLDGALKAAFAKAAR